ncbi:hypothetical protein Fmac_020600 [Flemingia macrophylla]|uniref:TF-B3 domain-containing protein n=1 Tax=Flemingia macrophylla TaxID=520843 RepID=A0ABD1LUK5_9FABA
MMLEEYVPSEFVRKHLLNMKQNVMMIQFRKKLWHVKFSSHASSVSGVLAGGWTSFATENELQLGDICIFELVNKEDAILDLHVFRNHCKLMH